MDGLLKSPPTTKLREKTLKRLCDAAERVFMEKNYYNASICDIVTGAGVSIGTFYNYFPDKLSMYKYIVLKYGQDIRRHIATGLSAQNLDSRHQMEREGIKLYLDYCKENPHVINIIWQSLFVAPELFIAYYDNFGKQYERQLAEAIKAGEVNPVNLEVASFVLMGLSNFLALKYVAFAPPGGLSDAEIYGIVDAVMVILRDGLFTKIV
ncbi:MAG: TetR/AcrR family transcriptional regulator [Clostridiales bacterium]|jgi:AcrR family transcriptional regulator|nr:TetR/AcrR family transcriptional regulator [Clostridiales bacterium]